jgi:hypothetical protein
MVLLFPNNDASFKKRARHHQNQAQNGSKLTADERGGAAIDIQFKFREMGMACGYDVNSTE